MSLHPLLSNWARETLEDIDECDRGHYRKVNKTLLTATMRIREIAAIVDKFFNDQSCHCDDPKCSARKFQLHNQSPKEAGNETIPQFTVPASVSSSSPSTRTTPKHLGGVQKRSKPGSIEGYLCHKKLKDRQCIIAIRDQQSMLQMRDSW